MKILTLHVDDEVAEVIKDILALLPEELVTLVEESGNVGDETQAGTEGI